MANINVVKPEPIVPPRKFVVELNEEEAALVLLLLGQASGTSIDRIIRERQDNRETGKAARFLSMTTFDHVGVYRAFREAFNG